ncbi:hypothetical protein VT84_37220 [Gemmata sp. SH-PL17]|nr:hypothetical protein VT84_37220 [Gemmata sp. SH-PL17]
MPGAIVITNDLSLLWSAATKLARETNHPDPRAVLVLYPDGSWSEVGPSGRIQDDWGDTPGPFPSNRGWSFRAGLAAFNGQSFRVSGLRERLLRALVDAKGEPVRDRALKARVWADTNAEDNRLKDVAYGLRAVLRAELELGVEADPVERVEGGYRLAVS